MTELNHVSCVEDDPDIRAIVELALVDIGGLSVDIHENGFDVLENLNPDTQLILMDMMMPGMNGLETLQKLAKENKLGSIPVIFMTAKAQPHEVLRFKEAGALDVIVKPFDPMSLADRINEIWKRAQLSD